MRNMFLFAFSRNSGGEVKIGSSNFMYTAPDRLCGYIVALFFLGQCEPE
jgi:hypothetical protein